MGREIKRVKKIFFYLINYLRNLFLFFLFSKKTNNKRIDSQYAESHENRVMKTEESLEREKIELETGGNVRFEYGNKDSIWLKHVENLIQARFCLNDYSAINIKGVKVKSIIRVHNR